MNELITQPMVQYGFLGFAVVLLGIIWWLIRRLLEVLEQTNGVIADNTAAIRENSAHIDDVCRKTGDLTVLSRDVHDKLLARPCIARGEAST